MPEGPSPISEELAAFLEGGVSTLVGTRSDDLRPAACRAMGTRVAPDRRTISVFIPEATAERSLANLRANGRVAVTFSLPRTYRSVQLKGTCVDIHPTPPEERERQRAYAASFVDELEVVGVARTTTARVAWWPSVTIVVRVEELFDQTPGPAAGRRMGA